MSVAWKVGTPPPNPSTNGAAIVPPLSNAAATYGPLNEAQSANIEGRKVLRKGGWAMEE